MPIRFIHRAAFLLLVISTTTLGAELGQKADTKAALTALETWLRPNKATFDGWTKFLDLTGLHQQLDASGAPDAKVLEGVLGHLNSGVAGLEMPQFVRLRDALSSWIEAAVVPTPADLTAAIEKAQADYHPPTAADLTASKARLEKAIKALDLYLAGLGKVGTGWKTYLELDALKKQLAAAPAAKPAVAAAEPADGAAAADGAKPAEDAGDTGLATLERIHDRFVADAAGLEFPPFLAAGDALENYIELAEATAPVADDGKGGKPEETYAAQLADLNKLLTDYQTRPTEEAAANIGRQLTGLWRAHLDRKLVDLIHRAYGRPNFYATIRKDFIAKGVDRPVSEKDAPLSDNILGTSINGRTTTVGQVTLELVPSPNKAVFDALLSATVSSRTVGQNGPATIYANGTTRIAGRKRVSFDAHGIHTVPATAAAVTRSQITGVSVSGLGQGVAEQRVAEQKPQAEQVGARHAEARLRARLDKEMDANLTKANKDFADKFRNPLVRRRQFPALFELSTTPEQIELEVLEGSESQLAASSEPPLLDEWEKSHPVVAVLHQSAVNNGTTNFLSGVTLKDDEVRQKIIDLNNGKLPEKLANDEDQEPWSIRFAKFRPISLEVRDGELSITVRGREYTTGVDRTRHAAMYITAVYKIEQSGDGLRLARQGDLEIAPPGFDPATSKLSVGQISLHKVLQRKFGKIFPPEIKPEPIELGGQWKGTGHLILDQIQAKDGWLSAAYRWVPKAADAKAVARRE